jgi:hypothetical protein
MKFSSRRNFGYSHDKFTPNLPLVEVRVTGIEHGLENLRFVGSIEERFLEYPIEFMSDQ